MELGNLTLMCMNLICVSSAGLLVIWAVMHIQTRERRRPRLYDEPHFAERPSTKSGANRREETF